MKKIFLLPFLLLSILTSAQVNVEVAQGQAFDLAKKGDYDKALEVLNKVSESAPNDAALLRDIAYYTYLKGDFDKAIDLGKDLIERDMADEQAFQILGSAYRMAKKYNESIDAYGQGITKYPRSAILYAELGSAYADNAQQDQAISIWEKGIKIDPNISNNYYYLANAYAKNQNALRSLLNAEVFVNMENKTTRTIEMRKLILEQYKTMFSNASYLNKYITGRNDFERALAESYRKFDQVVADGVTPESLAALRGQFIVDWYQQGNDQKFPFALFDRNRMMLKSGTFDAYNRWLFSSYNADQFRNWAKMNEGQLSEFTRYFNVSVLKFPVGGQNYF